MESINKAKAILKVCEYADINLEDVIGIGDSLNDLEMIELSHIGICMRDGEEALKAVSDYITDSAGEDGILHAFEFLELI